MGQPRLQIAGSVHAMISDTLDAAKRRRVQADHGLDAAVLSHWCDPSETNGRRMPVTMLDLIARGDPAAALVVAQHFAALAGAQVVAMTPGGSLAASVAATNRAAAEMSAHLIEATDPAGPGGAALTPNERAQLAADLDRAAEAVARGRAALALGIPE